MKRLNATGLKLLVVSALAAAATTCLVSEASCFEWQDLNPFKPAKYEMKVEPDVPVDRLYNEALIKLDKKDYENAAKRFAAVQKQYPFSQWSRKSLLMETYAYYLDDKFTETAATADRYMTLYPTSEDAPYINYLAGMASFGNLPDVHRDQAHVVKGVKYFQTILDKYPKSQYAEDARFKIQVARDQLAGHEMNIGRYYLQRANYSAAINRFHEVLAKYQNTRESEEALERLTEAYLAMGIVDEAQTAAAVLGHNYPNSQWYQEAFDRLKHDGLAPHENNDSWISKTFKKVGLG